HFVERWRKDAYAAAGLEAEFVQDNLSRSSRGTLRGLHYQREPHAQGKLVSVVTGRILDVAVDLRRDSPTFGQHVTAVLDDDNMHQLWVPRGFGHGFLVLSEVADVSYKVDAYHSPTAEGGVRWDDADLGIDWGVAAALGDGVSPLVSPRDATLPPLGEAQFEFPY
ncbi:MAG TPA: dTDP-4-dehydrorhamnose 3,5-epimerase, partial [Trueperaceae bacterium]|nr:dTDP-4-dehydrorhamnose 3,5-epimerase [Trueperaceae bacterium]